MSLTPDDDLLTKLEAAKAAHVSPRTMDRMIAAGQIDHVRLGASENGRIYIPERAITDYLNSRFVKAQTKAVS